MVVIGKNIKSNNEVINGTALICQETGEEAQGRGWKREAGDDAHGECHGPELC